MIAVILDTNAIFRDPWLTRDLSPKLLELAAAGTCTVFYPQVVIDELHRQRSEAAKGAHTQAAQGVQGIASAGLDVSQIAADLEAVNRKIESGITGAFDALLDRPNVYAVPVPDVRAVDLVRRDLERRRPFMEIDHHKAKKSVGLRDVLIWETMLSIMSGDENYSHVLIGTSDNGFLSDDRKSLHPDLLEDVRSRGLKTEPIRTFRGVPEAVSIIESLSETAETAIDVAVEELQGPTPPHNELVAAATEALYDFTGRSVAETMIAGGDYGYPDFVQFSMPAIDEGMIEDIDQTSEFAFSNHPFHPDTVVATADAVLWIAGAIDKGDWYMHDSPNFVIVGDLNDHYFEVSDDVRVQAVIELDVEGSDITVSDVVFKDPDEQPPTYQLPLEGLDLMPANKGSDQRLVPIPLVSKQESSR